MKKRIGISTSVFDANGAKVVSVTAETLFNIDSGSRRVTRTATLDGGSSIYDTGFAASDNTINVISTDPDQAIAEYFAYLVKNYNTVNVATAKGFYYAVPSKWEVKNSLPILVLLISEQVV